MSQVEYHNFEHYKK